MGGRVKVSDERFYDFKERLVWSAGFLDEGIEHILLERIPGCSGVVRSTEQEDRSGTDYWAERAGLPSLSVDVKVRSEDFILRGHDDLALETWSVVNQKVGWTRDAKKRTDFILWFWKETGRFFLVSFPALCKVFEVYWQLWSARYKTAPQSSGTWESECVFVPRSVVVEKLEAWREGRFVAPAPLPEQPALLP